MARSRGACGIVGPGVWLQPRYLPNLTTPVLTALTATPRLGAATTVVLFISGHLAASLVLDHYRLLGVPVHPIGLRRVLGVACRIAGVSAPRPVR